MGQRYLHHSSPTRQSIAIRAAQSAWLPLGIFLLLSILSSGSLSSCSLPSSWQGRLLKSAFTTSQVHLLQCTVYMYIHCINYILCVLYIHMCSENERVVINKVIKTRCSDNLGSCLMWAKCTEPLCPH